MLVGGGFFIFPLTRLGLALMGHRVTTTPGNPLNGLAMQVAFTCRCPCRSWAPLHCTAWTGSIPGLWSFSARTTCRSYSSSHYLPFVFLYGMRLFAILAALLVSAGIVLALYLPLPFPAGAWLTSGLLLLFAIAGRWVASREPEPP